MKLGLSELFRFLNANENSRNITKGEELIDARHLFKIGKINSPQNKLEIVAWCLQTSSLKNTPHQIKGTLVYTVGWSVQDMLCYCKARAGQQCTHIAAVNTVHKVVEKSDFKSGIIVDCNCFVFCWCVLCCRCDLSQLDIISSTDLKCTWAQKDVVLDKYKPVPLLDTPCFNKNTKPLSNKEYDKEKYEKIMQNLMEAAPTSFLALYTGHFTIRAPKNNSKTMSIRQKL